VGVGEHLEGFDLTKDLVDIVGSSCISGTVLIFSSFRILMAARELLMLLCASHTFPNPPYPNCLISLYSPKFLSASKSSPTYIYFATFADVDAAAVSDIGQIFLHDFNSF
jgi:hypothetical protein